VTITDLGTLGGDYSYASGSGYYGTRGTVNGAGQVVGHSNLIAGDYDQDHGFTWTAAGGMVDLTLGGDRVYELAVTEAGLVVGHGQTASGLEHAFSWTVAEGIVDLTPDDRVSYPLDFNEAGQVIGIRGTWSGEQHGFSWTAAGGRVDLTLGGYYSEVRDLNEAGQVVGLGLTAGFDWRGFLWSAADGMNDLGSGVRPVVINEVGQVIGTRYDMSTGVTHAFLWSATEGMVDFGTLGGVESFPQDVNDAGQVIGESYTASGEVHAFSWTATGGMVDLTLGGSRSRAVAVTNEGQVIGHSYTAGDAAYHAFSWTAAGGMLDLTPGALYSEVVGDVNGAGQVIGRAYQAGSGEDHGFSWTLAGGMVDFGPNSQVTDLNEAGQVVGYRSEEGVGPVPFSWTAAGGIVDLPLGGWTGHRLHLSETGLIAGTDMVEGAPHAVLYRISGSGGGGGGGGEDAETLITDLAAYIDGLDLTRGLTRSSLNRLDRVLKALEADKKNSTKKVCHELDQLLRLVSGRAFMRNLTPGEEAELVDRIVAIQAVIGC